MGEVDHARAVHGALAAANTARRRMAKIFARYDVMLCPTTSRASEPWGNYNLSKPGVSAANIVDELFAIPCQFTVPHNIMGTPAMSLPLAMHSTGVPIGVQIAAKPADEHVLLQVATALEQAMPWSNRTPPLHVSRM
ncbi:MAG: amidase [Sphingomonadales bacterium]|nr:amidase [Sphingomonadales bacterium]